MMFHWRLLVHALRNIGDKDVAQGFTGGGRHVLWNTRRCDVAQCFTGRVSQAGSPPCHGKYRGQGWFRHKSSLWSMTCAAGSGPPRPSVRLCENG